MVACEPVGQLVDHFRRQDYVVRLGASDWAGIGGDNRFAFEQLPEERPGQVSVRYKLETPKDVYPLVRMFEERGIELLDFRQETPTLEDIFLSITGDGEERR